MSTSAGPTVDGETVTQIGGPSKNGVDTPDLATTEREVHNGSPFAGTLYRVRYKNGKEVRTYLGNVEPQNAITFRQAKERFDGFYGTIELKTGVGGEMTTLHFEAGDDDQARRKKERSMSRSIEHERYRDKYRQRAERLEEDLRAAESRNRRLKEENDKLREQRRNESSPQVERLQREKEQLRREKQAEIDRLNKENDRLDDKVSELEKQLIKAKHESSSAWERGIKSAMETAAPLLQRLATNGSVDNPQLTGQSASAGLANGQSTARGDGQAGTEAPDVKPTSPEDSRSGESSDTAQGFTAPSSESQGVPSSHAQADDSNAEDGPQAQQKSDEEPPTEEETTEEPPDVEATKKKVVMTAMEVLESGDPENSKWFAGQVLQTHRFHKQQGVPMQSEDWAEAAEEVIERAAHDAYSPEEVKQLLQPIADKMLGEGGGWLASFLKQMGAEAGTAMICDQHNLELSDQAKNLVTSVLSDFLEDYS